VRELHSLFFNPRGLMEPYVIDRKAWHYELAYKFTTHHEWNDPDDFCSYCWTVFGGLLWTIVVTFLFALGAGSVMDGFIWLYVGVTMQWVYPHPSIVLPAVALFGCVSLGLIYLAFLYKERRIKRNLPTPFVVKAYRSFKEKHCSRVQFTGTTVR
jgi:hypothetical protein